MTKDEAYIKELEGLVCFLAKCYQRTKQTYFADHMYTCSTLNPDRRDLTKAEQSEWTRFPLIQGMSLQNTVKEFAESDKPNPVDLDNTKERFLNTVEKINKELYEAQPLDCPYDFTSRCTIGRCDCKPKTR